MNWFSPVIRDRAIFLGWIAGLLIAGALLWILTGPLQARYLLRAVNKEFISMGDSRRLASPLRSGGSSPAGFWFSLLESGDRIFVFGLMRDGILIPCGARVSPDGKVQELIPLGEHARQSLSRLPEVVTRFYIRRIEASPPGKGDDS